MNVKPGDVAYIILNPIYGRVVTVAMRDPEVSDSVCWFYEGSRIPVVGDPKKHYVSLRDEILRPINDPPIGKTVREVLRLPVREMTGATE